MKPSHRILALLFLTQLSLYLLSIRENIVAASEILFITTPVVIFLLVLFNGFRWARWFALVILVFIMLIVGSMTFEGFGGGFICVAFLYAVLIVLIFNYRVPVKSETQLSEADHTLSATNPTIAPPPVEDGFHAGDRIYHYPLLVKRYQSLLIDALLWLCIMTVTMVMMGESPWRSTVMISLAVIALFIYEPVLTAYSTTLGQQMIGIRVRKIDNPEERISLFNAYARVFVKWFLGWLSFITINFNAQHRAIHDMAGSSVVVKA